MAAGKRKARLVSRNKAEPVGDLRTRPMKLDTFLNKNVRVITGRGDLSGATKRMFPMLGTTQEDGTLLTIPSLLRRNSEFVSQCHLFGTKVNLYCMIDLCDRFGLNDFDSWPAIHQQQYYVKCMNYHATSQTTFDASMKRARAEIMPQFPDPPDFKGAPNLLDDFGTAMMTNMLNFLKVRRPPRYPFYEYYTRNCNCSPAFYCHTSQDEPISFSSTGHQSSLRDSLPSSLECTQEEGRGADSASYRREVLPRRFDGGSEAAAHA